MVKGRLEVIQELMQHDNICYVAKLTKHSVRFVREIRKSLKNPQSAVKIFQLKNKIGRNEKITTEIEEEVINFTLQSRRVSI